MKGKRKFPPRRAGVRVEITTEHVVTALQDFRARGLRVVMPITKAKDRQS